MKMKCLGLALAVLVSPSQYNCATRITPDILSFVYNNTNLSVGFSNN